MSWNIKTPGDYINGPLTVAGATTINGDLAVDVNVLKVDSALNRVGINITNPAQALDVDGAIRTSSFWILTGSPFGAGAGVRYISGAATNHSWYQNALVGGNHYWAFGENIAMTLNGNGLGLGNAPAYPLYVYKNQSATTFVGIENQQNNAAGGAGVSLAAYGGTWDVSALHSATFVNPLVFRFNNAEKARLTTLGAFVLAGGNTTNNGVGVAFPAAQSASTDSNTLDDYEEGTFTPVVRGSSVAGSGTYTNQKGFYTKVGRLVTVNVWLVWTAHDGTGFIQFGGLPFVSSSTAGNYGGISIGYQSNISSAANTVLYGLTEFGTNIVTVAATPVGGGSYGLVSMDTSGEIAFTATYWV
jgi:hypothetical protein